MQRSWLTLSRTQWIVTLFIVGIFFIVLSVISTRTGPSAHRGQRLAQAHRETGEVQVLLAGTMRPTKLTNDSDLGNFDSLETNDLGEAILQMESGFALRVLPNSTLTLERIDTNEDYHVVLILKHGDVKIESNGRLGELFISKNGKQILAQNYNDSDLRQATLPAKPATSIIAADNVLSEEEITSTVSNFRPSFFKCYTRLLQRHPETKGEAVLNFTILNSGKVDFADAQTQWNTGNSDEDFTKCLKEIVLRMEFRPFQGAAVSTAFPLHFD